MKENEESDCKHSLEIIFINTKHNE